MTSNKYIFVFKSEKDALRVITRRLNDRDPHVSLHSLAVMNSILD